MRILTGLQPSGVLHIGNYFGAIKPLMDLQGKGEVFLFLADLHALTSLQDAAALRQAVRTAAIDLMACGLDVERTILWRQSDVPLHSELMWVLSTVTPMGLMERMVAYKEKTARGISSNVGLFTYPILQAADILAYDADLVPVGRDQKQHLEATRDIAVKINEAFGAGTLKLPEPAISEHVAVVPGLDGQKMSKSYGNTIDIFMEEKALRKRVMSIVTDSTPLEDPKNPDGSIIVDLYRLFATPEQVQEMKDQFRAGGMGYGHFKQRLFEAMWEYFAPMRARREEIVARPGYVDEVLAEGARRADAVARPVVNRVFSAVGLR
ncbi:tryptophan--tRNA ligase [Longimicrobium terrae]|uniref:Tryptophan--tRNA ligase n=1 Tax=Longimicrobium terrae TaxID=1639882 RepID=A0A841H6L0_9BACT|nr:tryptophan--tRNA ligase [Longimicrobium terrae]MBB4638239.1 tryptophanyl-tRNA synthetase [Longimicrobium terrae]MBB6073791.1 tryptophanyl-tRNA synthetase [Longimicrobium terrae]NNC30284.1 tryptophan--tRNA ligase [Longimicrobium terrae]